MLTDEEVQAIYKSKEHLSIYDQLRAIESAVMAKLREQNEPVGYLHKSKDDNSWDHLDFDNYDDEYGKAHWDSYPIYLHPAPIPEVEAEHDRLRAALQEIADEIQMKHPVTIAQEALTQAETP